MRAGLLLTVLGGLLQVTASCSKADDTKPPVSPPIDTAVIIPVTPTDTLKTYLALGDSYTIGQSVPVSQNYPNQTAGILHDAGFYFHSPEIIAVTGWTTGNLLDAVANKAVPVHPYDIVTLLIGVNNQYQGRSQAEYKTQFITLLQKSIAYAGSRASHVIVLSIPDYSVTPYGKSTGRMAYIASQIDSFNLINKQVSDSLFVKYLNVTDESRKAFIDSTLIASDGLHYSGKEYGIWSSILAPIIENIFK